MVLGFPSNDFGNQEVGNEAEVKSFCSQVHHVQFSMFTKSHVRGGKASSLYRSLAFAARQYPHWNVHKYLIGRDGKLLQSFTSSVEPDNKTLIAAITTALKEE